jgi:CRISPR-associated protein Csm4
VARKGGEEELKEFLKPFLGGQPPFVLSDGYPEGMLPPPVSFQLQEREPKEGKIAKSMKWVDLDIFNRLRSGEKLNPEEMEQQVRNPGLESFSTTHVAINRETGTALPGQLFDQEEAMVEAGGLSIYALVNDSYAEKLAQLFKNFCRAGYGRRKSVGKGHLEYKGMEKFDGFAPIKDPNGFISLSSFVPAEKDPSNGYYRLRVKYGKVGEEKGKENPFKRPLIQLEPGACFFAESIKGFYGRMVRDIAVDKDIVQYGYCLALPVRIQ